MYSRLKEAGDTGNNDFAHKMFLGHMFLVTLWLQNETLRHVGTNFNIKTIS